LRDTLPRKRPRQKSFAAFVGRRWDKESAGQAPEQQEPQSLEASIDDALRMALGEQGLQGALGDRALKVELGDQAPRVTLEERAFVAALGEQTLKAANVSERFTAAEAAKMAEPHAPESFLVCCVDSRFQPAKALDYGPGTALEYRTIACVVPPAYKADPDLKSKMAFCRLKDVQNILLVCHSDCGGCQAALTVPHPDPASEDDLHTVASFVHLSGLDVPLVGKGLLAAEGGSIRKAGDRLAREIGVKSLQNLLGFKGRDANATVEDDVKAGRLNVMLLYYDLEKRSFDIYEARSGTWKHTPDCDWLSLRAKAALHNCAEASRETAVSLRKSY
jgi:carbonic anhydrase